MHKFDQWMVNHGQSAVAARREVLGVEVSEIYVKAKQCGALLQQISIGDNNEFAAPALLSASEHDIGADTRGLSRRDRESKTAI